MIQNNFLGNTNITENDIDSSSMAVSIFYLIFGLLGYVIKVIVGSEIFFLNS